MTSPLHTLELTLWHPETRYDRALMEATFAPDFHEFGRSGRRYTRDQLLNLSDTQDFHATLHVFTARLLSDTIAHCIYISQLETPDGTKWANHPPCGTTPQAAGTCAFTKAPP